MDRLRRSPFLNRHLGPSREERSAMAEALGYDSLDALIEAVLPPGIRTENELDLPRGRSESEVQDLLREISDRNEPYRSFIGMGYHRTVTPPVIRRGVLENPGWYTQYTPYQSEISQGRLEALLNFQTLIADLTGLELANASLLDEGTAAAEAMTMLNGRRRENGNRFFVAEDVHPQTLAVLETRAEPVGIELEVGPRSEFEPDDSFFGALIQYPATDGAVFDAEPFCARAREAGVGTVVAADPMSLVLLRSPGSFGADVAVGSTQRFGVPMALGGPHAAYFAAAERFERDLPGRIIGVSRDQAGRSALRMALQTREQHIRRERATSNICTAQVLLAIVAGMYGVYHGPEGLRRIARRIHGRARELGRGLRTAGYSLRHDQFFDTLRIEPGPLDAAAVRDRALAAQINLRYFPDGTVGVALDEATTRAEIDRLMEVFGASEEEAVSPSPNGEPGARAGNEGSEGGVSGERARRDEISEQDEFSQQGGLSQQEKFSRQDELLEHPVFHRYRTETEMMRYLHRLEQKDLSLTDSMIPLGSCTMKLNPTAALEPITWEGFTRPHPFAPSDQIGGYRELIDRLRDQLAEITGFPAVTLQPNSGAQGEYTGLLMIRAYHRSRGDAQRRVCLIPESAHGTNPASAVMAGMEVEVVGCDEEGNVDLEEVRTKAAEHGDRLAAIMITYPSTHGVFERDVREICEAVHEHGGQVYLDGANMNAQLGLSRPAEYGVDVCHLNLHKTFSIPHGGGGPGVGPVAAAEHLAPFLPGHPLAEVGGEQAIGPVAAAPWGSAGVLPVSWAFIALLGKEGLTESARTAILSANYMADRLEDHYPLVYRGPGGRVAHEFIIDFRSFRREIRISEEDVAKRLMDYGFHAPTMSWPVTGSMMIEPTESESRRELDRFCDAMIAIREEIARVERGEVSAEESVLRQAPHTAEEIASEEWDRPYSREEAAFPADWTREHKFWPAVGRVDNAYGDRNLTCTCPPLEAYAGRTPERTEEPAETTD